MSDYRRYFVPGGTFFFTVVTARRRPLFSDDSAAAMLGAAMRQVLERAPVKTIAIVLLRDHLHALWQLPAGDSDYAGRWRMIKREFTRAWLRSGRHEAAISAAQRGEGRRGIWQRRYWEHTIRDEQDLEAHYDYIHYNPVKHGLATRPCDWPWSSFQRAAAAGQYSTDWGAGYIEPDLPGNAGE